MKTIDFHRPRLNKRMTADELLVLRSQALTIKDEIDGLIHEINDRLPERERTGRERRRLEDGSLDPRVQAGPKAIAAVRSALRGLGGRASQAAIGHESGIRSGTLHWAIKALELDGEIRPTGKLDGRSPIVEFKKKRRVTRLEGS